MDDTLRYWRWIAIVALSIGYAVLAHYANVVPGNERMATAIAIAPILLACIVMAWRSKHRKAMMLTVVGGVGVLLIVRHSVEPHSNWIFWMEHAGTLLLVCWFFARSLTGSREPLCSFIARLIHGSLAPEIQRYTRNITLAWAIFTGLMSATSTVLFFAAPLANWSAFANFFTGPLIVLMFVIEYIVRRVLFPDFEHVSIMVAVRAVRHIYG